MISYGVVSSLMSSFPVSTLPEAISCFWPLAAFMIKGEKSNFLTISICLFLSVLMGFSYEPVSGFFLLLYLYLIFLAYKRYSKKMLYLRFWLLTPGACIICIRMLRLETFGYFMVSLGTLIENFYFLSFSLAMISWYCPETIWSLSASASCM